MRKLVEPIEAYVMLGDIDNCDQDVTSWEAGFIDSCMRQWEVKSYLSRKQIEIIMEMHERYLGSDD